MGGGERLFLKVFSGGCYREAGGLLGVFRERILYAPYIFPISSLLAHRVGIGFMLGWYRNHSRKTPGKPLEIEFESYMEKKDEAIARVCLDDGRDPIYFYVIIN